MPRRTLFARVRRWVYPAIVVLAVLGVVRVLSLRANEEARWERHLGGLADVTLAFVESWQNERLRDARSAANHAATALTSTGSGNERSARLALLLDRLASYKDHAGVWLVAVDGRLIASSKDAGALPPQLAVEATEARRKARAEDSVPITVPEAWFGANETPRIGFGAVVRAAPDAPILGVLFLASDPTEHVLAFLRRLPHSAESDEFRVVLRIDGQVALLSSVMLDSSAPAWSAIPIERTGAAVQQLLTGEAADGRMRGAMGVEVLSAVRPADVGLLGVVGGIDGDEAMREANLHALREGTSVLGLFGLLAVGVAVRDRRRRREAGAVESRMLTVLDEARELVALADVDLTLLYLNPEGRRMLGWSAEMHLDANVGILHPPHVRDRFRREILPTIEGGSAWQGVLPFRRTDGSILKLTCLIQAQRGNAGEVESFSLMGRDTMEESRSADILRASALAAERLLSADSWESAVPDVLAALGESTQADRVYVFENGRGPRGELIATPRFEWSVLEERRADGRDAVLSYVASGLGRWVAVLQQGGAIAGPAAELSAPERAFLQSRRARSVLIVPVRVEGRWWGFVGFDDQRRERSYAPEEIDLLRASASTLGAAIARTLVHAELRHSDRRHRLIAENFPNGAVMMFDHELRYTLADGSALDRVGLRGEEMLGRTIHELFPMEICAALEPDFRRALAGETGNSVVEFRSRHFRLLTAPVRGDDGGIQAGLCVAHDITEAHSRAVLLRRSEEKYRALVDHAAYGIYRSTPEGRFLSVNPALVRMLGYPSAEALLTVDLRTLYIEEGEGEQLMEVRQMGDAQREYEVAWRHATGRPLTLRLSGRAVRDADDEIEFLEIFVEDLTDRRELEAQLRQAQKMEAIGQLVGGIAHDFNNVLTTVMGNADFVIDEVGPRGTDSGDAAADIRDAAESGASLIRKMMMVSRKQTLDLRPQDLATLTSNVLRMARRLLPTNIELESRIPDLPRVVKLDPGAVEQILLNLLTNARDAMPLGGRIVLSLRDLELSDARRADLGLSAGEHLICLDVEDSGTGMDAATVARVFEPFFTTKPAGSGTGLGLAMVYGLMKQHGGAVIVESTIGVGTTIQLIFPAETDALVASAKPRARAVGGDELLLIVDDNDEVRHAAARLLERSGYRVIQAADGESALRILRDDAHDVSLVLADVMMPKLGGRQLFDAAQRLASVPRFLFSSGYQEPKELKGLDLGGEVGFLPKPWTVAQLTRAVRRAIDGEEPKSASSTLPT